MSSGKQIEDSCDTLILATGSNPIRIPLDGYDAKNVFVLKTLKDAVVLKKQRFRQRPENLFQLRGQLNDHDRIDPVLVQRGVRVDTMRRQLEHRRQQRGEVPDRLVPE